MAPVSGIKNVAVIGAGSGGLAAAKYLAAEHAFDKIEVFEQRPSVGGLWCATPDYQVDNSFTVPRTRPSSIPSTPVWQHHDVSGQTSFEFLSPIYNALDTNIPYTLMNYSDQPFPQGTSLFPSHSAVREYLERYADDVRHLLSLGTQVVELRPADGLPGKWSLTARNLTTKVNTTQIFDSVVVANGHYDDPYIPGISGIKEWNAAYPGAISHSKFYRTPMEFKNKKVIVVGHSASGVDIADQAIGFCQLPVLISEKEPSNLTTEEDSSTRGMPEIQEFLVEDRAVRFVNGHIETDIDCIIFCTGYMYSFPFVKNMEPALVSDGSRTQNLYQQIFYLPAPTLSFIGLPQRIVPFPLSEGQGSVIARVLSGRLSLPSPDEMQAWESSLVAEKGAGRSFHTLGFPQDAAYMNLLHDWALSATPNGDLENDGVGKISPYWEEEQQWIRERVPLIKMASRKLDGAKKNSIKSLKELGFDFEQWKIETSKEKQFL
ncbi:MAG: hypothetical protein M1818_003379 [Claussenomyces sp. TS43310]|nr:MAG: hypothetical protein M1818_003379 [Claussenomyces sp. TS43310]